MPASLAGRLWYPRRAPPKVAIRFKGVFGANSDAIALRIASASALIGATRESIARKSSVALHASPNSSDVDHDALESEPSQRIEMPMA